MPGGLTGSHESLLQGTNILLTLLVLMASLKSAVVRPGVFPLAPLCWCLLSNSLWVRDKGCLSVPNPSFTHNTRSGKTVVQLLIVQACWSVTVLVQHLSAVAGVNPWRSFGYFHRRVCCQAYLDRPFHLCTLQRFVLKSLTATKPPGCSGCVAEESRASLTCAASQCDVFLFLLNEMQRRSQAPPTVLRQNAQKENHTVRKT